jgi:hypothetical protein
MEMLKDQRLYTDNNYAVESLKIGINLNAEGFHYQSPSGYSKTNYHCYWYGKLGRKQIFSIKSFLCTQNLAKCKIILWIDINNGYEDYKSNAALAPILHLIEVKAYDPYVEIQNTPWANHISLLDDHNNLAKRSDAFRYIILHKYGGVYFDLDVMFLKDFDGLLNCEFCYTWEDHTYANTAVLRVRKNGYISNYLLEKSIFKQSVLPWKIFGFADTLLTGLYVLPCAFFDAVWQGLNIADVPFYDFSGFFRPFDDNFVNKLNINSYKDFFPGCYAYHWHNQWNTGEYTNSFFGIFEKEFNLLLGIDD